jgi:hypothetical protein
MAMIRWIAALVMMSLLAVANAASAQPQELSVSIVGRGDDAFKELISRFEMKTGIKVALKFPNFIAARGSDRERRAVRRWNRRSSPRRGRRRFGNVVPAAQRRWRLAGWPSL